LNKKTGAILLFFLKQLPKLKNFRFIVDSGVSEPKIVFCGEAVLGICINQRPQQLFKLEQTNLL